MIGRCRFVAYRLIVQPMIARHPLYAGPMTDTIRRPTIGRRLIGFVPQAVDKVLKRHNQTKIIHVNMSIV